MFLKSSLVAVAALLAIAPAAAQHEDHEEPTVTPAPVDPNAIRLNIPEPESARTEHRAQLQAGTRYLISATSEAFDPYIRLMRAGSDEVIAEDDDSGGGVTPRLFFTPPTSGEYVVQVSSFAAGGSGDFALSVTPQAPMPALISRPTRTERGQWQIFQGELAERGPAAGGLRYQDYELRLAAGETAMLHVQGENVDTVLQVFTAADRGNVPVATDDDGGGGTNPFVFFAPEEAGTYVVRVVGFDAEALGSYRLRVSK